MVGRVTQIFFEHWYWISTKEISSRISRRCPVLFCILQKKKKLHQIVSLTNISCVILAIFSENLPFFQKEHKMGDVVMIIRRIRMILFVLLVAVGKTRANSIIISCNSNSVSIKIMGLFANESHIGLWSEYSIYAFFLNLTIAQQSLGWNPKVISAPSKNWYIYICIYIYVCVYVYIYIHV